VEVARWHYNLSFIVEEIKAENWFKTGRGREEDRGVYIFIYLFLINACNLKVMVNFTDLNNRNPHITLGSCWALSQYRS
jgi:hypothetical protein